MDASTDISLTSVLAVGSAAMLGCSLLLLRFLMGKGGIDASELTREGIIAGAAKTKALRPLPPSRAGGNGGGSGGSGDWGCDGGDGGGGGD